MHLIAEQEPDQPNNLNDKQTANTNEQLLINDVLELIIKLVLSSSSFAINKFFKYTVDKVPTQRS